MANDWDINQDSQSVYEDEFEKSHLNDCRVFVWGLNDKDQLGGMKGSKIKIPTYSESLSRLRPVHIAGGSKSLFIVSQSGKVSPL